MTNQKQPLNINNIPLAVWSDGCTITIDKNAGAELLFLQVNSLRSNKDGAFCDGVARIKMPINGLEKLREMIDKALSDHKA